MSIANSLCSPIVRSPGSWPRSLSSRAAQWSPEATVLLLPQRRSWALQLADGCRLQKRFFFFSLSFFPFANEIFFLNLVLENMTLGIKIEDKSDLWVSSSLSQSLFLIKTTPLHQHLQCKQLLCWLRTDSVQFSFLARIGGTSLGEKKHFYQQMSKTHRESGLCITACSIDKQSSFKFWHCTSKINMQ